MTTTTPATWLVPLPTTEGEQRTIAVHDKTTAVWLSRLIAFAPADLLKKAGPIPPHTPSPPPDLFEACKMLKHRLWIRRAKFKDADHDAMSAGTTAIDNAESSTE